MSAAFLSDQKMWMYKIKRNDDTLSIFAKYARKATQK